MTREELLSKLYFLRAGMSLIAGCKKTLDDYSAEQEKIRAASKKKIQQIQDMITESQQQLQQQSSEMSVAQRKEKGSRQTKTSEIVRIILWSLALILCFGVVYILVATINFGFLDGKLPIFNSMAVAELILISLQGLQSIVGNQDIAALIYVVILGLLSYGAFKLAKKGVSKIYLSCIGLRSAARGESESRKKASSLGRNKHQIEEHLQELRENAPKTIAKIREEEAAQLARLEKVLGEARTSAISIAKNTYDILVKTSVIDNRDWASLDLIIFALETGRADTLKEALLIVDQERRNDALVHAVESASQEVARTIQVSTKKLQGTIRRATEDLGATLSASMAKIGQEVRSVGAKVESGMAEITAQQSQIHMAQQAQIALQREANRTSEQLARTVASTVDITGRVRVTD